MIYISIDDIIFLIIVIIFLIIIYKRIRQKWNIIEKAEQKYSEIDKRSKFQQHIKDISRQPVDRQKIIFKDAYILIITIFIIILIGTKSLFFVAIISDSMVPTFNKNDIVLIQNIDRKYNVGDIIMFKSPDLSLPVSHRIVSIDERGIHTAGDATNLIDWWTLKNENIMGKAIIIFGKPIAIKEYGKFFIIEDKNQRIGPFDYQTYYLFINVIRAYGYGIIVVSIFAYTYLSFRSFKNNKDKRYKYKNKISRY